MKSVIAQGATVTKAIDEALKKSGNPKEFFIKLLQEGQSGFLGFGSTKAKVALFFKKIEFGKAGSAVLSQSSYKDLFGSKSVQNQINQKERVVAGEPKPVAKKQPIRHKPQKKDMHRAHPQPIQRKEHKAQQPKAKIAEQKSQNIQQIRNIKQRPLKIRPSKDVEQKDQKDQGGQKDQKPSGSSSQRVRRGSGWWNNRDKSKKTDDGNKSE